VHLLTDKLGIIQREHQVCIAFELDRDTEKRRAFRSKVAALLAWSPDGLLGRLQR
jgi:hypothetical protein